MSQKLCTVPLRHELLSGQHAARKNSTPEDSGLCSMPSGALSHTPMRRVAVSIISGPTESVCAIRSSTPKACVLPPASSRPVEGCHWHAPQTRRYALDHSRLQCHHRSPLLKTQWSFSRLLGAQIRTQGRITFLGCTRFGTVQAIWFCLLHRARPQLCRRPLIDSHRAFLMVGVAAVAAPRPWFGRLHQSTPLRGLYRIAMHVAQPLYALALAPLKRRPPCFSAVPSGTRFNNAPFLHCWLAMSDLASRRDA